ncbi:MAG: DAK2 domain-containing protein [Solirubrobacterales bacterium]|nr:DAK2 domain-containing protein [Solirubrobacterales bacterium]
MGSDSTVLGSDSTVLGSDSTVPGSDSTVPGSDVSLLRFRAVLEAGLAALEARREEVNGLNVFPVPDGDTGDNMVLTMRAVLDELDRLATAPPDGTIERLGRDEIVASVARAALLGARGNAGVILSQLIRGAAEELASRPGELVDPVLISAALARAADQAYGSVRDPVEGTILTVVREMGVQVASEAARMPDARLAPDASAEEQNAVIATVIERALKAGESSVTRGPDRLAALRRAGVVDAGGYALTVFVAGIVGALRGGEEPAVEHRASSPIAALQRLPARPIEPEKSLTIAEPVVCGAVAVATGAGMESLFESLGVRALDGGPSLTPSTYELLAAIQAIAAEHVVVLPNSPSALETARRAAQISDKAVCVVPSFSPQAGLAAPVALDPTRNSGQNAASMTRALEHIRTGAVAPAVFDDAQGRFHAGDAVGFVEEEIVAWGRPREALREVLERLAHDAELITCLRGAEAPLDDGTVQALAQGDVEFELSDGGQQAQWWLLAAE